MERQEYTVIDNKEEQQFEIHAEGKVARMIYYMEGAHIIFHHTYVPKELEGRGVGSALVRGAFNIARKKDRKVIVHCPFTLGFTAKHPEFKEQLAGSTG
jgi:uncharacterized protein